MKFIAQFSVRIAKLTQKSLIRFDLTSRKTRLKTEKAGVSIKRRCGNLTSSIMNASEYLQMHQIENDLWWYGGLRAMIRKTFPKNNCKTVPSILDAGCGTGANLRCLRALAPNGFLLGVDASTEALELLERDAQIMLCRGDVNRLPLACESFDVVFAGDLLGQRGVRSRETLGHFFRALKPGGVLLLNVPAFSWLRGRHDLAVHVDRRFEKQEINDELVAAGFTAVHAHFWNCLLLPILLVIRRLGLLYGSRNCTTTSDLKLTPPALNRLLRAWMEVETTLATKISLPFGSSLFVTAGKPSRTKPPVDPPNS